MWTEWNVHFLVVFLRETWSSVRVRSLAPHLHTRKMARNRFNTTHSAGKETPTTKRVLEQQEPSTTTQTTAKRPRTSSPAPPTTRNQPEGQELPDPDNGVCGKCWEYDIPAHIQHKLDSPRRKVLAGVENLDEWVECTNKEGYPFCGPCGGWFHKACLGIQVIEEWFVCFACIAKKRLAGPSPYTLERGPVQILLEEAEEFVGRDPEGEDVRVVKEKAKVTQVPIPLATERDLAAGILEMEEAWNWLKTISTEIIPVFRAATMPSGPNVVRDHKLTKSTRDFNFITVGYPTILMLLTQPNVWQPAAIYVPSLDDEDYDGAAQVGDFIGKWMMMKGLQPDSLPPEYAGLHRRPVRITTDIRRWHRGGLHVVGNGLKILRPYPAGPIWPHFLSCYESSGVAERLAVLRFLLCPSEYYEYRRLLEGDSLKEVGKEMGTVDASSSHSVITNVALSAHTDSELRGWVSEYFTGDFSDTTMTFSSVGVQFEVKKGTALVLQGNKLNRSVADFPAQVPYGSTNDGPSHKNATLYIHKSGMRRDVYKYLKAGLPSIEDTIFQHLQDTHFSLENFGRLLAKAQRDQRDHQQALGTRSEVIEQVVEVEEVGEREEVVAS